MIQIYKADQFAYAKRKNVSPGAAVEAAEAASIAAAAVAVVVTAAAVAVTEVAVATETGTKFY